MQSFLVTGSAGFIGYHLTLKLLENGHFVVGIDNINDYYSTDLKKSRLSELGINLSANNFKNTSNKYENFSFYKLDISNYEKLTKVFNSHNFEIVCNLAAQPGVRYSLINPNAYITSNLVGFSNIIQLSKENKIKHFVYASSSSVYGESKDVPFSENQFVDNPISLYAATKKSNELIAHSYSHLFGMKTTGLRFFTVYGPWGRPDMAYYLFTDAIFKNKEIKVFNDGKMRRDFTFIDDIVNSLSIVCEDNTVKRNLYEIYNIGNNNTVELSKFIQTLENIIGIKAIKKMLPAQPGDVTQTFADINKLKNDYFYTPKINIEEGLDSFVQWYKKYNF